MKASAASRVNTDLRPIMQFLTLLAENNQRAWFDEHRGEYQQARVCFEDFVDARIAELEKLEDLQGVSARSCIFRINRDARFSKDKSPYRTNFGALIGPGGRASAGGLGYYLHLQPGNRSMLACGLYQPAPALLAEFRRAVAEDARPFKRIIENKTFIRYFKGVTGERLTTAPQGYLRDHPEIELLRFKQVLASHPLSDREVLAPDFASHTLKVFKAMKPFLDYLRSLDRTPSRLTGWPAA